MAEHGRLQDLMLTWALYNKIIIAGGLGGAAPQKLDGFACLSWLIVAVFAT